MRSLMCFCLLTLLHFKVVLARGWDDCSACVKPLSFQGNLRYAFTYYQYLSPACSTSISECTRGGTIYYKGKLTGLTGFCKNKGTIGQTVCWKKNGDPLKAWNDKMTGGRNKPHYVWAPYLSPHPHINLLREKPQIYRGHPEVITYWLQAFKRH
jgi:hypothetical protein